jgi:hypothetical protein
MTGVAILLQAEAERLAPEKRLIVIRAAGVKTDVSTECPHVAELGARNLTGGLGQTWGVAADVRVGGNISQALHGPDPQKAVA